MVRILLMALLLVVPWLVACADVVPPEKLPYQHATGVTDANGKRILKDWSASRELQVEMTERYHPDSPAFAGAEVWHIGTKTASLNEIVREAFSTAGMTGVTLLAKRNANPIAVAAAAPDPDMKMTVVMVAGELQGKSANGIGYVFYGLKDDNPGVSAFMAPSNVFVALGGHIVPEVHWYLGTTEPDHDLIAEGRLSAQQQVDEASLFFTKWVLAYVIPLNGIQGQRLEMMKSWSNAMNVCAGDLSCTVTLAADGSGTWVPAIDR